MRKYSWDSQQIEGLRGSIKHWEENLEKAKKDMPLLLGNQCCPLCKLFNNDGVCDENRCPLAIVGEGCSFGSAYSRVIHNREQSLVTLTEKMLQTLKDTLEAGLPETKFKVGDRVRIIDKSCDFPCLPTCCGKTGVIESPTWSLPTNKIYVRVSHGGSQGCSGFTAKDLELIQEEKPMSEYSCIKSEIEALDNGWDKKADDLLQRIQGRYTIITQGGLGKYWGKVFIYTGNIWVSHWDRKDTEFIKQSFTYTNKYEKMSAFKKALIYLLDHSSIKKEEAIKVGDWVVGINANYFDGSEKAIYGDLYKVWKINNGFIYWNEGGTANCSPSNLRLATPEEIREHEQKGLYKQQKIKELENKVDEFQGKIYDTRREIDKLKGE